MPEIERKFLVHQSPLHLAIDSLPLRQGYLAVDSDVSASVRVRQEGRFFNLTAKTGSGLCRGEEEIELTCLEFDRLWTLTNGRVEKTRYTVPLTGHKEVAVVDVFKGPLQGLLLVEVEFDTVDRATAFTPPDWFGDEVTEDPRYTNASLARFGLPKT